MNYTKDQWTVFGEVVQKSKGVRQVSEEQGLSEEFIRDTLAMWHKDHPELFAPESEKASMRSHVSHSRRKRENIEVISYDAVHDADPDYIDSHIRKKF